MAIKGINQIKNNINPLGQVKSGTALWGDVQESWADIFATW